MSDLGWWTISGEELLRAMRRTYRGEMPDTVYAEMYANAFSQNFSNDDSEQES